MKKQVIILPFLPFYKVSHYVNTAPIKESIVTGFGLISKEADAIIDEQRDAMIYIVKAGWLLDPTGKEWIDHECAEKIETNIRQMLEKHDSVLLLVEDKYKGVFYNSLSKIASVSVLDSWDQTEKKPQIFMIPFNSRVFKTDFWLVKPGTIAELFFMPEERLERAGN